MDGKYAGIPSVQPLVRLLLDALRFRDNKMSQIVCPKCLSAFDGEIHPECPECLGNIWTNSPGFVKAKHDPSQLPSPMPQFRTVLSHEFVDNLPDFAGSATKMGTWYYNRQHDKYFHFTDFQLHTIPGSAIFKGDPMPTVAYYGLIVADPINNPHAFCEDIPKFQAELAAGRYEKLPRCSYGDCHNLSRPASTRCLEHSNLPD